MVCGIVCAVILRGGGGPLRQAWVQASDKIGMDLVDRISFSDKAQNDEVPPPSVPVLAPHLPAPAQPTTHPPVGIGATGGGFRLGIEPGPAQRATLPGGRAGGPTGGGAWFPLRLARSAATASR